jgi:hypothetical protein
MRESEGLMSEARRIGIAGAARNSLVAAAFLGAVAVSGCSSSDTAGASGTAAPYMPVAFAMPADTDIDSSGTVVVGDNINWYGTLALTSGSNVDASHQFYADELPREGFEPLATLVANRVVLQYVNRRQNRSCIVTIEPRSALPGSHIEVVCAPLTQPREAERSVSYLPAAAPPTRVAPNHAFVDRGIVNGPSVTSSPLPPPDSHHR